jgi:hypothetical protein
MNIMESFVLNTATMFLLTAGLFAQKKLLIMQILLCGKL